MGMTSDAWLYGKSDDAERILRMAQERDFLLLQLERLEENIQKERRRLA
jgi:putative SOS response-associated peptidase YedK